MKPTDEDQDDIRTYVEIEACEDVLALERVASVRIAAVRHDVWDVETEGGRWWAVTSPLAAYDQADLPDREVALSCHVGVVARLRDEERRCQDGAAWRAWERAATAVANARAPRDGLAVGAALTDCLASLAADVAADVSSTGGHAGPGQPDASGWISLFATELARVPGNERLAAYIDGLNRELSPYATWLAETAVDDVRDCEIAVEGARQLLEAVTLGRQRLSSPRS